MATQDQLELLKASRALVSWCVDAGGIQAEAETVLGEILFGSHNSFAELQEHEEMLSKARVLLRALEAEDYEIQDPPNISDRLSEMVRAMSDARAATSLERRASTLLAIQMELSRHERQTEILALFEQEVDRLTRHLMKLDEMILEEQTVRSLENDKYSAPGNTSGNQHDASEKLPNALRAARDLAEREKKVWLHAVNAIVGVIRTIDDGLRETLLEKKSVKTRDPTKRQRPLASLQKDQLPLSRAAYLLFENLTNIWRRDVDPNLILPAHHRDNAEEDYIPNAYTRFIEEAFAAAGEDISIGQTIYLAGRLRRQE